MGKFNPEKLSVEFRQGVTKEEPIIGRHYTLTHSDKTAQLFLTIGKQFAYDKINPMRDEVLAEWKKINDKYSLNVYLYVGGQFGSPIAGIRNMIFRRELPLALKAIRYGDKEFFKAHPELDKAPIVVYFNSPIPYYNRVERWGTPSDYKYEEQEKEKVPQAEVKSEVKPEIDKINIAEKDRLIATMLNPYIEKEIHKLYKRNERFCLNEVEILAVKELKTRDRCRSNFDVAVGLRVGKNPPPYNNLIIEFSVTPNSVTTKSVKNPR